MTAPAHDAASTDLPAAPTAEDARPLHLVMSGTGLLGARVAALLRARGARVRAVSRSSEIPFDWTKPETWDAALVGVQRVYLSYAPDLAVPGASDAVAAFLEHARTAGVQRIVLLSGRGETEAQKTEGILSRAGFEWTSVRAAWFLQNVSVGPLAEIVATGALALPARADVKEPFVDVRDIAEVAAAAMAADGPGNPHAGRIYDVTGPDLLTFGELMALVSAAAGRAIPYLQIPADDFAEGARAGGFPEEMIALIVHLMEEVLDGRNAHKGDGVQQALGRPPRSALAFAAEEWANGHWRAAA